MKIQEVRDAMHSADKIMACVTVTGDDWIYLATTIDELESALCSLESEGVIEIDAHLAQPSNVLYIGE